MDFRFKAKPIFNDEEEGENFFLASQFYKEGFYEGNLIVDGDNAYLVNGVVECTEEYMNHEEWVPVHLETIEPLFSVCKSNERAFLDEIREKYELKTETVDGVKYVYLSNAPSLIYQSDFTKTNLSELVEGKG